MLPDIRSQTAEELGAKFQSWGQPAYRVTQLLEWLYAHRVSNWEAMTNLPKTLRDQLRKHYSLTSLELVRKQGARDTTEKFLWRLSDGALIESVLIPANPALYGEPSDRLTLCVSTQVGCAYGCKFCASGLAGWQRNLRAEEIVGQVLAVERWSADQSRVQGRESEVRSPKSEVRSQGPRSEGPHPEVTTQGPATWMANCRLPISDLAVGAPHLSSFAPNSRLVSNLVIMGMGEPLANYENLLRALKILNAPWGGGIGARKITISTSGLAPQIRRLADEPLQFRLAISLHGATDVTRDQIMPVNRKYPLAELTAACEFYQRQKGRMITFEYVLISGVNDARPEAQALAVLARRFHAKVNLIAYNRVEGLPWERPTEAVQEAFLKTLLRQKVSATLRREKGGEIDAACGQLRLRTEKELIGR